MKIKLQSRKQNKPYWVNGWRWKLEFTTWGFYQCEIKDDYNDEFCDWIGNTRKEYKQHLKERHAII